MRAYELLLEWFLSQIKPDFYFISSLFEHSIINSVKKLKTSKQVFVIFHDLILLIFEEHYLRNRIKREWYLRKLEDIKRADYLLCISEASKRDLVSYLGIPEDIALVISLGADKIFCEGKVSEKILNRLSITRPYILYVLSGADWRKNIEGLIKAFAILPGDIKKKYLLVIASRISTSEQDHFIRKAKSLSLNDRAVFTGYVSDEKLVHPYRGAGLMIYPSFYEGFGLPILE